MRVLVTGAAGFLGRAVVAALVAAGHDVRAGVRRVADPGIAVGETPVEAVVCDVLDTASVHAAVAGVDAVCHLAARVRARESAADPAGYWATNVVGTLTVLDALAGHARPPALVLLSTIGVHGAPERAPVAGTAPVEPPHPYAATKLAAELAVRDAARAGLVRAVTLRATNVAGAAAMQDGVGHADGDMTRLVPQVVADHPRLVVDGDGSARRDYVHAEDVADAVVRSLVLATSGVPSAGHHRVLDVGSGVGSSVLDVVAAAERATGVPVALTYRPADPAAGPGAPPLVADVGPARDELGWSPWRSDLDRIVADARRAASGPTAGRTVPER